MSTAGDNGGDMVPQHEEEDITIPALFVTMAYGNDLSHLVVDAESNSGINGGSVQFISIVPYVHWYPPFHYSTILLWCLAMFALWILCYLSAKEKLEEDWCCG